MILITGDTHGDRNRFALLKAYGEPEWTAEDSLFVGGNFGYFFLNNRYENDFLDALAKKPYTICFIDGNYEIFPAIYRCPTEVWNREKVHCLRENIVHLMRGQVFTVGGTSFFTMGGAYSIDRYVRQEGFSWWEEELPDDAEYKEAAANLQAQQFRVDYILSHTAPREIIRRMGHTPDAHDMELTGFLEWVTYETQFKEWFSGHWHVDQQITEQLSAQYFDAVKTRNQQRTGGTVCWTMNARSYTLQKASI